MDGLSVGRVVHFLPNDGRNPGECRAATIVKVWNPPTGCSNLAVLYDGTNDLPDALASEQTQVSPRWRTSVNFDAEGKPYTWHWPQACPCTKATSA